MQDLFSEDPTFRRVQYTKLSDNPQEWAQEISAIVSERLPRSLELTAEPQFQQIDESRGYAIGTAIVRSTKSPKSVGIPIIVKSWNLSPIDLFFQDGKLLPLNEVTISKAFFESNLGAGLAPERKPPQMADDAYAEVRNPPMGGKYTYSSDRSMCHLLKGTIGAAAADDIAKLAQAEPGVLAALHRHGNLGILKKYAEKIEATKQDDADTARAKAVMSIKKEGPDSYLVYSTDDHAYDPICSRVDRAALRSWIEMRNSGFENVGDDPLGCIDRVGEYTIAPPEPHYGTTPEGEESKTRLGVRKTPYVFNPLQHNETPKEVSKTGRYGVIDSRGVMAKGWIFTDVVNLDGSKGGVKVFIGPALGSFQTRFVGIPVDNGDATLRPDDPVTGKVGVLLYQEGKEYLCTVPFQVVSTAVQGGMKSIGVVDYKGNRANLIMSPLVNGIMEVTGERAKALGPLAGPGRNYFISHKLMFVSMPRLTHLSESADDFKKVAMTTGVMDIRPLKVTHANGQFAFKGAGVTSMRALNRAVRSTGRSAKQLAASTGEKLMKEKLAFDFDSLSRLEAEFLLRTFGLDAEKTAHVLAEAKNHVVLEVHHLRYPAELDGEEKTASEDAEELVRIFCDVLRGDRKELLKIASMIDDAESVDTVLSLGFVNPENVGRFVAARPMLEECQGTLCKLLLASRLGTEDIPEDACRSAIAHIGRVIDGLDRLRMLGEQQEKTSGMAGFTSWLGRVGEKGEEAGRMAKLLAKGETKANPAKLQRMGERLQNLDPKFQTRALASKMDLRNANRAGGAAATSAKSDSALRSARREMVGKAHPEGKPPRFEENLPDTSFAKQRRPDIKPREEGRALPATARDLLG